MLTGGAAFPQMMELIDFVSPMQLQCHRFAGRLLIAILEAFRSILMIIDNVFRLVIVNAGVFVSNSGWKIGGTSGVKMG